MTALKIDTAYGPARVYLHCAEEGEAVLMLGHGAGGGLGAKDLVAVTRAAQAAGVHVALVEQPYKVAGRRAPAPANQLDAAWLTIADDLAGRFDGLPFVFGGRSSGARVACRTAAAGQAVAVLCLAFPEHPPGRPEKTRQPELDAVEVPVLVVQGERDPFGRPKPGPHHELVIVDGDHNLGKDLETVSRAATEWLSRVLRPLA
ncbi:MAG TPA: alpha/beta family hydrolase [Amycolatopsis sp.]|uniref:Alpha/beta hydrolase n=1 Tax=Amycolatopsis nalaikhensis TaxID=715472 RepID=A0ABY8XZW1_9PSEU|nr:alpha/beta family hydrolase [Amycolatopsis sp. 2-2]WIV61206.1 alpha/beta hydrolase [Amycolatopsis sp. 2-2]